jgi:hypothetical protein
MTEVYSTAEEERLDANLRDVAYELDTPATVSLITGEGRIERVCASLTASSHAMLTFRPVCLPPAISPAETALKSDDHCLQTRRRY